MKKFLANTIYYIGKGLLYTVVTLTWVVFAVTMWLVGVSMSKDLHIASNENTAMLISPLVLIGFVVGLMVVAVGFHAIAELITNWVKKNR